MAAAMIFLSANIDLNLFSIPDNKASARGSRPGVELFSDGVSL